MSALSSGGGDTSSNYLQILSGNVQQSPTPTTYFTPEHFLQGTPSIVETPDLVDFMGRYTLIRS